MNASTFASALPPSGDIVIDTIHMRDVPAAFDALSPQASREYYKCTVAPTDLAGSFASHFKGVARFGGKLIFTHTDLDPFCPAPNGKYLVGNEIVSGNQGTIDYSGDTLHPCWRHPCRIQVCGNFMAIGIQASADGDGAKHSEIQIYDVTSVLDGQPATLVTAIPRLDDGINGVGMTREATPDGRYIVAGVNGKKLSVYRTVTSSMPQDAAGFPRIFHVDFPDSGAGLGLITQTNGDIYLVSMNADDSGADSQIALYQLDLDNKTCTYVTKKAMPVTDLSASITLMEQYLKTLGQPFGGLMSWLLQLASGTMNTSFRWGRGLVVTSSDTFEIYATDRNVLVIPPTEEPGSEKDFSILVWGRRPKVGADAGVDA